MDGLSDPPRAARAPRGERELVVAAVVAILGGAVLLLPSSGSPEEDQRTALRAEATDIVERHLREGRRLSPFFAELVGGERARAALLERARGGRDAGWEVEAFILGRLIREGEPDAADELVRRIGAAAEPIVFDWSAARAAEILGRLGDRDGAALAWSRRVLDERPRFRGAYARAAWVAADLGDDRDVGRLVAAWEGRADAEAESREVAACARALGELAARLGEPERRAARAALVEPTIEPVAELERLGALLRLGDASVRARLVATVTDADRPEERAAAALALDRAEEPDGVDHVVSVLEWMAAATAAGDGFAARSFYDLAVWLVLERQPSAPARAAPALRTVLAAFDRRARRSHGGLAAALLGVGGGAEDLQLLAPLLEEPELAGGGVHPVRVHAAAAIVVLLGGALPPGRPTVRRRRRGPDRRPVRSARRRRRP